MIRPPGITFRRPVPLHFTHLATVGWSCDDCGWIGRGMRAHVYTHREAP